jgi:N-acetylglucosaminyldiphosphoundecaprenol N-acetyl-beta-D-mannosaminyltransferase
MFTCFGVPIEGPSLADALKSNARWIVTANPEILLAAKKDKTYRDILNTADLRVADGIGLTLIARLFGHKLHRVTGVDLAEALIKDAKKIALIGGTKDTAERALKNLNVPGIALQGGTVNNDGTGDSANDEALHQLILESPDLVLVAFGHPKQEQWIAKNLPNLPSVRRIIGVGGTFDYWARNIPRAPKWIRSVGLEWLFRLVHEPSRIGRILNAVVAFPLYILASSCYNAIVRKPSPKPNEE